MVTQRASKKASKKVAARLLISLIVVFLGASVFGCLGRTSNNVHFTTPEGNIALSFSVTADMRSYTGDNRLYFRGVCETINAAGPGDFMISPGDIDPPSDVRKDIDNYIGVNNPWYAVVGNHEAEIGSDMQWIVEYNGGKYQYETINPGPTGDEKTSYSFDRSNAHFVVLNEYFDGTSSTGIDGDVSDSLYDWLSNDLATNQKPLVFVFGHEPAYPQPDEESGRERHMADSLNKYPTHRDRFWALLSQYRVTAYVCGHTHNYSAKFFDGVWQIDAGHARGIGDLGSKSTFIMFYVMEDLSVWAYVYRLDVISGRYMLSEKLDLQKVPVAAKAALEATSG